MKPFILIVGLGLCAGGVLAQPGIEWQATYGGMYPDYAKTACHAKDNGFAIAGITFSNNTGQVTQGYGGGDFWVIKIDESGKLIWQKVLGGSSTEVPESIFATQDGGYILTGRTASTDWDISGNHGFVDFWVIKLDSLGNKEWQKCLGGTEADEGYSIIQTSDNGYMVVGSSVSTSDDLIGNNGQKGGWIVKLAQNGQIEWQKIISENSSADAIYAIEQTADEGYILTGITYSTANTLMNNHGSGDVWVARLDKFGELIWQRALGGAGVDFGQSIKECSDGGYVVSASAGSNDGDVTENHGALDAWVIKLNSFGEIEWQKCFGGYDFDWGRSITKRRNNGFSIAGTTRSTDGDVIGSDGSQSFWVVDLDSLGNLNWQKPMGGTISEKAVIILETVDNGLLIAGESDSKDGDITHNFGDYDFWVVKLAPASVATSAPQNLPLQIIPNPAQQFVSFELPNGEQAQQVFLSDLLGREILRVNQPATQQIDLSSLPGGVYVLSVITSDGQRFSGKFRRE